MGSQFFDEVFDEYSKSPFLDVVTRTGAEAA